MHECLQHISIEHHIIYFLKHKFNILKLNQLRTKQFYPREIFLLNTSYKEYIIAI